MGLPSPGSPGVEARSIAIRPASPTSAQPIEQASPAGDGCASSANPRATTLSLQLIISKKKTSSILTGEEATYSLIVLPPQAGVGVGTVIPH